MSSPKRGLIIGNNVGLAAEPLRGRLDVVQAPAGAVESSVARRWSLRLGRRRAGEPLASTTRGKYGRIYALVQYSSSMVRSRMRRRCSNSLDRRAHAAWLVKGTQPVRKPGRHYRRSQFVPVVVHIGDHWKNQDGRRHRGDNPFDVVRGRLMRRTAIAANPPRLQSRCATAARCRPWKA